MNSKSPREITGRRERPTKPPLSREIIVSTALELLKEHGLAGMSLRRVATALDTGAASLYVYIANIDELYGLMLDQAIAAITPPKNHDEFWRERLKTYLLSYLHVLYERDGLAHLAMSTIATGPNSLRMWEVLLSLLREGGIEETTLVKGVDMLLLHVTAVAAEECNQRAINLDLRRVPNALASASSDLFPIVSSLFQRGLFSSSTEHDDDARVRAAIDVIVDGLLANQLTTG
jgi:AcrR family transcriptional regulator